MKHIYEDLRDNEILIMIYDTDNEESILTLWRLLTLSGWKHGYFGRKLYIRRNKLKALSTQFEFDEDGKVQSAKEVIHALTVNYGKMMGEFDALNFQVQGLKTEAASSRLYFKAFASTRKAIFFMILYEMGRDEGMAVEIGCICRVIDMKKEPGKSADSGSWSLSGAQIINSHIEVKLANQFNFIIRVIK